MLVKPAFFPHVLLKRLMHAAQLCEITIVVCGPLELLLGQRAEQLDGIVMDGLPQCAIQSPE